LTDWLSITPAPVLQRGTHAGDLLLAQGGEVFGAVPAPPVFEAAWMALFCQNMLEIAFELAAHDPTYEELASNFAVQFLLIGRGITVQAVRQRLDRLLAGGLVAYADNVVGRGRPRRMWSLTAQAAPRDQRDGGVSAPFAAISLIAVDAVPPSSEGWATKKLTAAEPRQCIVSKVAVHLANRLRWSVQSNGRSNAVSRVAVSSTGCRPCSIASTRSGLRNAR
jgi:hypothetical protein